MSVPHASILERVYGIYDDQSDVRIGFGFLIGSKCQFLVTAAHVVYPFRVGDSATYNPVRVKRRYPLGEFESSEVVYVPPAFQINANGVEFCEQDYAILKLANPVAGVSSSAMQNELPSLQGVVKILDNRTGTVNARLSSVAACIHVELAATKSAPVDQNNFDGMSGGPAWDDQTQQILGVFTSSHAADLLRLEVVPLYSILKALPASLELGASPAKNLAAAERPDESPDSRANQIVQNDFLQRLPAWVRDPVAAVAEMAADAVQSEAAKLVAHITSEISNLGARETKKTFTMDDFRAVCRSAIAKFSTANRDDAWRNLESDKAVFDWLEEAATSKKQRWWYLLTYPVGHELNTYSHDIDLYFEIAATILDFKVSSNPDGEAASVKKMMWELSLHWNSVGISKYCAEKMPGFRKTNSSVSKFARGLVAELRDFVAARNLGINVLEGETAFSKFDVDGIQLQLSFSADLFDQQVPSRAAQAMAILAGCFSEFHETRFER